MDRLLQRLTMCAGMGAVAVFGLLNLSAAVAQQPSDGATYQLAYKFEPQGVVRYRVKHDATIDLTHQSTVQTIKHGSQSDKHMNVVSVDGNGAATMELVIDRVKMYAGDSEGNEQSYDSGADAEPPEAFTQVAGTINKPLARVTMDRHGAVRQLTSLVDGGQDQVDASLFRFFIPLPSKPVAVGAAWKEPFEVEVMVTQTLKKTIKLQRTYTLEKVDGALAYIRLRTAVLTPIRDPKIETQLVRRKPQGVIVLDIQRGTLISRTAIINEQIVNFAGAGTLMKLDSEQTEKLVMSPQVASDGATQTK